MTDASKSDKAGGRVLLPPGVEPVKYSIRLTPDLVTFDCDGKEDIEVEVSKATSSISLHSRELYVEEASFCGSGGKTLNASAINLDLKLTTVTFIFPEEVPVGTGTLSIKFRAHLNNQMAGFYRSGYESVSGEKRVMASTQFESLDARRCFPCWDEPARKAVFEVTLVVPNDRTAFSNMPEVSSTELAGGKREIKFMPSPKMSTYLLAFCVGEFDFVQGITQGGVTIRVYTPPGKSHLGEFALENAKGTLDIYDEFFKVPYPLPKLDMVAIPEFAMGAMENWGLVTYREVDLLIDPAKASSNQRQRVCTVITHELAHQWFGNLVTMEWWDDLWLNEGFASWTENYAADKLHPEWGMWEQFTVDAQSAALRLDSLRSSHPIQVPIAHAEEVEQVFDAISYCKGACVVKMIHAVLGAEKFQEGLQVYMERHKYSNTETYHLWSAWEEVSGKPISKMMASWTEQMGHPVITVTKEDWGPSSVTLELEQSWFLADGSEASKEEEKLWTVPLLFSMPGTAAEPKLELMSAKAHKLTVPLEGKDDWVNLNAGQHTLMRVLYTPEMMKRLEEGVRSGKLPPENRAGLLGDTYALAKAGKVGPERLVQLLPAFKNESNSTVWKALEMILVGLDKLLMEEETMHAKFAALASSLVTPAAAKVGWESRDDDGHTGKLMRGTMIGLLSRFCWGSEEVQAEAKRRFAGHLEDMHDQTMLPSDFTVPVYAMVLKSGGQKEFDQVMGILDKCETTAEKKMVYLSIGACSTRQLKARVLEWAVSEVKLQDFFYPMHSVSSSGKMGLDLTWEFYQANFDRLKGMLAKAVPSLMDACIMFCCGGFSDAAKADEVEAFFKSHPLPSSERKISQMLETMRVNARFLSAIKESPLATPQFWEELGALGQ